MSNSSTTSVEAALRRAVASHRVGQLAAATAAYQAVIAVEPGHAEANHNLGVLMVQAGRIEHGLAHLAQALKADGRVPLHVISYARGLLAAGRLAEAEITLARGRAAGLTDRQIPILLDTIGCARVARGEVEGAIALFRAALEIDPDLPDVHYHLGSVLSQSGHVAEGFEHYMRRAALVHGVGAGPRADQPDPPHKLGHDLAQRAYLASSGARRDALTAADLFQLAEGARIEGPAINPANDADGIFEAWRASHPRMVVIDDFLTAPALERLRAYCAGSTIWRKIYDAGYLGASPEDGFACPLMAQIIEEIQASFRPILAGEPFQYLGAFKYDSELSAGTNTHADNSAVNVNFYITPDAANLDPASGGMVIWDVSAPDVEAQRRYSSSEDAVRDLLRRSDAKATIVPYRSNRAVIFRSSLFHKTDKFRFKHDYMSRRINISLLFGQLR